MCHSGGKHSIAMSGRLSQGRLLGRKKATKVGWRCLARVEQLPRSKYLVDAPWPGQNLACFSRMLISRISVKQCNIIEYNNLVTI